MNDDDNEGMRSLVRGKGKKAKASLYPDNLLEVEPGKVVFIAVRVGAHMGGAGGGGKTDTVCRPYDVVAREELYRCGDLWIPRSHLVGAYTWGE